MAKLSLLTFPQKFEAGKLDYNILIIPRNLNPLLPFEPDHPAFAEAILNFKALIINKLEGLPVISDITDQLVVTIENPSVVTSAVWEALRKQIKESEGLTVDETETVAQSQRAEASIQKYKGTAIRKHLPETYTSAFNFTKARTKYATTGDEYECAVQKGSTITDTSTMRDTISWGKVLAMVLRNPLLAQKAGLIYKATITIPAGVFDEGGWLFTNFADGSDYVNLDDKLICNYGARIPPLKNLLKRNLFSPVLFPVLKTAATHAGYDEIMREAIIYDDGFAKIVHANQPVNQHLLKEKDASNTPVKDVGIRLGWDDEQMLIWHNRQMRKKEELTDIDVDAPLGVFGYRIDARKSGDVQWLSQNTIISKNRITIAQDNIDVGNADAITPLEPGVEIHPAAHGNSATDGFWLPMYFTNWMGKVLSIPDKEIEEINDLTADSVLPVRPDIPANTINSVPKKTFHPFTQNPEDILPLIYGNTYDFRIRFMDITGGGPKKNDAPVHQAQRPVDSLLFKRNIGATQLQIENVQKTVDAHPVITIDNPMPDVSVLQNIVDDVDPVLTIFRPLLQYPAVVFTGKYADPIAKLKNILSSLPNDPIIKKSVEIGLPDPDVNKFLVKVEVQSLQMDNAKSATGKEPFIKIYEKEYSFDTIDYDKPFALKVTYQNFQQLDFEGVFSGIGMADDELVLPTARHLRLTFIPLITNADDVYAAKHIAKGRQVMLTSFIATDAAQELNFLSANEEGLKAIYLQPETDGHTVASKPDKEKQRVASTTPVEIARLADTLNLVAHKLTLEAVKGQRIQFGCSKIMRHSLAPDSTSITFSSLAELFNNWIIAVDYTMNRDWAWDGLEVESIHIIRSWKNVEDSTYQPEEPAGIIHVTRTASINSLIEADRINSRLLFLDVFDPKNTNNKFPQEINLRYRIIPKFKQDKIPSNIEILPQPLHLPVTIAPIQIPKLISAGIALSDYLPGDKYATTQLRQRFLWLEVAEPVLDSNDAYFVRVLANVPDPMLCLVDKSIELNVPQEPPLNINEEKIRVIIPGMNNDYGGLMAMQTMVASDDTQTTYYMAPLPDGLHASSDELFGFFSYEIRVGHSKKLWSTAQARFGRPLKVNGVQHPAPALCCNVFRKKYRNNLFILFNEIVITAPFANAVLNGKNVAADPPQTTLWYLLYAQVKQADGATDRNILLYSKQLRYQRSDNENKTINEGTRYGSATLKQETVSEKLRQMGLPINSSLSVLCVEMFPLNNIWRMPQDFNNGVNNANGNKNDQPINAAINDGFNPLIEGLGRYRIYRTSPLVAVGDICCDDC